MLTPKKSLGQNFLHDEKVLEKIISSANLKAEDFVMEVGPGKGALTEKLVSEVSRVVAIEIDQNLITALRKKFIKNKKVEIINEDILKINLSDLFSRYKIQDTRYKIVANIPYYITSKIIRLFLETKNPPDEMILMVQKEVAERITSRPGKMSLLSVSVQYYSNPELLFTVSKNSFYPAPQVDSAVIKIKDIHLEKNSKHFFQIAKAGFSAKRKTLVNNLSNALHLEKGVVEEKIKTADLKSTVRAQELSIVDWKKLVKLF